MSKSEKCIEVLLTLFVPRFYLAKSLNRHQLGGWQHLQDPLYSVYVVLQHPPREIQLLVLPAPKRWSLRPSMQSRTKAEESWVPERVPKQILLTCYVECVLRSLFEIVWTPRRGKKLVDDVIRTVYMWRLITSSSFLVSHVDA